MVVPGAVAAFGVFDVFAVLTALAHNDQEDTVGIKHLIAIS